MIRRSFTQKNSRVILALCSFFLSILSIHAKEKGDTIIFTHLSSIDPLNRTSIYGQHFSFITGSSWNLEKRELTIHQVELKNYRLTELKIKIPTSIKILQCPGITLNESYLLLQDDYNLKWFLFKNVNGEFRYMEEIILPSGTMAFKASVIENDLFLFTDVYNHHPLDSVNNTSIAIYNAATRKFTGSIHPEIPCIGLSHFPQHWISFNSKKIALADPCGKRIQFFDMQLKPVRTIHLPSSVQWTELPENKIPFETSPGIINPKEMIAKLEPRLTEFSRMESIHFVNDSLLMISIIHKNSVYENFAYNIKAERFIDAGKISIATISMNENVNEKNAVHVSPYQLFRNDKCISLEEDNFLPDPGLTMEQNEVQKNLFYEKNDPEFIIRISTVTVH